MKTDYNLKAKSFLKKTNSKMTIEYLKTDKYFDDDKEERDIYNITLSRGLRSFSFTFGNSIANSRYKIATREFTRNELKGLLHENGTLKKYLFGNKYFTINNNDKIDYPKPPSFYDILACMEKYDVGSFEDFCNEFGYDVDSRKAEKTYIAVCNEYKNLCSLYNEEEIEQLADIN
jgi:hypothetical protein